MFLETILPQWECIVLGIRSGPSSTGCSSEGEGKVIYRYGEGTEEVERMDYLEFIARVTSHVPDKGHVTVRYIGLYANAHRGNVRKMEGGKQAVVDRIINHLKLTFVADKPPAPRIAYQELLMAP